MHVAMGSYATLLLVFIFSSVTVTGVGEVHGYAADYPLPLESVSLHRGLSVEDKKSHRRLSGGTAITSYDRFPIYHMLGSYFAYLWVGTPPQRVSVIIDTGSHFTAFPCAGCNCGKHIDPYFDPKASSTSEIMTCFAGNKCYIKQSYSEGSSWHAYKVKDRVWVGDKGVPTPQQADVNRDARQFKATNDMVALSSNLSTMFTFGCQDKEEGLFRTQQIDGIMGLTAEPDTLPFILERQGITKTKAFSLCFTHGRGVLSLGGVDPSLHLPSPRGTIKYARLLQSSGWFTVRLLDVLMRNPSTGEVESIGVSLSKYNGGRGTIVDSGTTDTYLPADIAENWNRLFAKMSSGMKYSNRQRNLEDSDLDYLPTIIYRLEGLPGNPPIEVESPPSSYTELIELQSGRTKKAFRIYTTEKDGTVLGANFMVGHNLIFDIERQRIGIAGSDCEQVDRASGASYNLAREHRDDAKAIPNINMSRESYPYPHIDDRYLYSKMRHSLSSSCGMSSTFLKSPCTAKCPNVGINFDNTIHDGSVSHLAEGFQEWSRRDCVGESQTSRITYSHHREKCSIFCDNHNGKAVRGTSTKCKAEEWSTCSPDCEQQRYIPAAMLSSSGGDNEPSMMTNLWGYLSSWSTWLTGDSSKEWKKCNLTLQKRSCHVHKCPVRRGDSAVTMLLHIAQVSNLAWSKIHKQDLISAVSKALLLPEGIIHGENVNTNGTSEERVALHMRIRVPDDLYFDSSESVCARIAEIVRDDRFPNLLAHEINGDSISSGKWRWMTGASTLSISNVVVKKLVALKDASKIPHDANLKIPPVKSNDANKSRTQAINEAKVRNYKKNANFFNIDYSAYGSPQTWDRKTWLRILIIAFIQGGALAVFFVLRRARTIKEQYTADPTPSFDAFKGVPESKQKRVRGVDKVDRFKGTLDRRVSRAGKLSTV